MHCEVWQLQNIALLFCKEDRIHIVAICFPPLFIFKPPLPLILTSTFRLKMKKDDGSYILLLLSTVTCPIPVWFTHILPLLYFLPLWPGGSSLRRRWRREVNAGANLMWPRCPCIVWWSWKPLSRRARSCWIWRPTRCHRLSVREVD